MTNEKLIEERRDYTANSLHRHSLNRNPVAQFTHWLADARAKKLIDATAMALSSVDANGQPHSRIVLLKHFSESGFAFYTNYDSDKGRELGVNNKACVLFYWRELERQVRIEGCVKALDTADADTYFRSRPEGSKLSAAASRQSTVVQDRSELELEVTRLKQLYPDNNVPRPANWGGYILQPVLFEFWQGRADRLHDRFQYNQIDVSETDNPETDWPETDSPDTKASSWKISRLAP